MKKIIYISHWRFPSEKTMTPLIMKTCEGFIQEGFSVELWIPRRPNGEFSGIDPFTKYGIQERFTIRRLPCLSLMHIFGKIGFILMVFTFNISVSLSLCRVKKDGPAIILYGHDIRNFVLPSLSELPIFVEIHDFYESKHHFVNKIVLERASGLIVTNTYKQNAIASNYAFPGEKMLRQPNAVSSEMFDIEVSKEEARERLGLPTNIKIALYTGHLFPWKGVYTLAEAGQYMPEDTCIYFVGGTKEDRELLKCFVADRKIQKVFFLDHQDHSKIPLYLKSADVLVLPNTAKESASKYETSPVKLFEYMASGVPIVASSIPSIQEIVSSREVFFFTPDDSVSLANVVEEAIHSQDKAMEKVHSAKALARNHSWPARAKAIADFINKNL
ncbi:MAG: glycosyltransferase [bacterium]|nr:glycosyltransferase [bacterium]